MKRTFASRIFKSRTFASGIWAGVGAAIGNPVTKTTFSLKQPRTTFSMKQPRTTFQLNKPS